MTVYEVLLEGAPKQGHSLKYFFFLLLQYNFMYVLGLLALRILF